MVAPRWYSLLAFALVGLVACDDSSASTDASPDVQVEDLAEDLPSDLPGEDASDTEDVEDEAVTSDPDIVEDPPEPDIEPDVPSSETQCADGLDDDLDGDLDCDDSDCADDIQCTCEEWCIRGGECVCDPAIFPGPFTFISGLHFPSEDAPCCFDFDNDGLIDSALTSLAEDVGALLGLEPESEVNAAIEDGRNTWVWEWGKGAEGNGFWGYRAANDLDRDGENDHTFEQRAAGDGVFQLVLDAVDEEAPLQLEIGAYDGDEVTLGPGVHELTRAVEGLVPDWQLRFEDVVFQGVLIETETGIGSPTQTVDRDGVAQAIGTWKLGAVLPIDEIGRELDQTLRECTCAGLNSDSPVLEYGDDGGSYGFRCVQAPTGECTEADGICQHAALICGALGLQIESAADIDRNDNGVADSLSVGLWLRGAGATLGDPPVAD